MASKSFDGICERLRTSSGKADARAERLRQLVRGHSVAEIAEIMCCTVRAVESLAQRNGISLRVVGKAWSRDEEKYVRRNAELLTVEAMAKELDRTAVSVRSFCQYKEISLIKRGENHPRAAVSNEDVELCRQLHEAKMPLKLIARKMELNQHLVQSIVYYRRT